MTQSNQPECPEHLLLRALTDRRDLWRERTERRKCARSPWLPWSLSVLSTADPNACRSGLNCSGLHDPALPDMDFRNRASSNFFPNIMSETGSTDFVECLVRLQAEASADDLPHDLGGAAEALQTP
jgi:hypothetical protein